MSIGNVNQDVLPYKLLGTWTLPWTCVYHEDDVLIKQRMYSAQYSKRHAKWISLPEFGDDDRNNKQNQNSNDRNSYNPICSHPNTTLASHTTNDIQEVVITYEPSPSKS